MASKKTILLVDDDIDLCKAMRSLLLIFGVKDCVYFHSLHDLKNSNLPTNFDVAILDINLGDNLPNGIDVYNWLIENNYQGKVVFFSGHAKFNPLVQTALKFPNVTFLEKPANVDSLQELVT